MDVSPPASTTQSTTIATVTAAAIPAIALGGSQRLGDADDPGDDEDEQLRGDEDGERGAAHGRQARRRPGGRSQPCAEDSTGGASGGWYPGPRNMSASFVRSPGARRMSRHSATYSWKATRTGLCVSMFFVSP